MIGILRRTTAIACLAHAMATSYAIASAFFRKNSPLPRGIKPFERYFYICNICVFVFHVADLCNSSSLFCFSLGRYSRCVPVLDTNICIYVNRWTSDTMGFCCMFREERTGFDILFGRHQGGLLFRKRRGIVFDLYHSFLALGCEFCVFAFGVW